MCERRVLGIDPGTRYLGYAVVYGTEVLKPQFATAGVESLIKITDPYARLAHIHTLVVSLIEEFRITELAIEAPFYGKNPQSMLKLGRAQGVAIAASLSKNVNAVEYSPRKVKEVVTSSGQATKGDVARRLRLLFPDAPIDAMKTFDATDALSIALCHYYLSDAVSLKRRIASVAEKEKKSKVKKSTSQSWSNYLAANPERVVVSTHDVAKKL
ncbi:MAG: crossover junction endodeoxyribonuclease RuvC [Bacteroides sp.]